MTLTPTRELTQLQWLESESIHITVSYTHLTLPTSDLV